MKIKLTRYSIPLLFSFVSTTVFGQIISYTNAPDGSLNSIAANVTATKLSRVNGATVAANPCATGFSSGNYSSINTYSISLGAVEVSVTPKAGYILNVSSLSADLGRSTNGPSSTRYAYSKDGGSTWISQTSTKYLQGGICNQVETVVWSTPVQISAPSTLKFRIYGFNAIKTTAKQQILNLKINGTVSSSTRSCAMATGISAKNITSSSATLDWNDVAGAQGYNIQYRKLGATTWISSTSVTSSLPLTSLTASTSYEFRVQTKCAGTSTSAFSSAVTFTTTALIVTNSVPAFSHIVVVIGENTNSTSVFGSSDAPYINALAAAGAKFTNSFALTHPSQPNYLQLYSGSNQGVTDDSYITTKFTTANLGKELINAGKTYTTYSEGLPSVGYDGKTSGLYVRKHNPAANWMGTGTNQIPATTNQPFTSFPTNFNNLPSVSFVIPDMCNDGHDVCAPLNNSTKQYDTWIKNNLDAYKRWCVTNNSLLIVTYDEDDFTPTNKIATVFYGANVRQGSYSQTINHYNVLRTLENAFKLSSHAGAAATATPIDFCWTSTTSLNSPLYSLKATENNISGESAEIFPDPANDVINVTLKNNALRNASWEITNISGVKFKSGNVGKLLGNGKIEIAVDNLKNGIYFLRINDGVNTTVKKFVIAR